MEIKGKKFGIIGAARTGLAVANKISSLGGKVFIFDSKDEKTIVNADLLKAKFNCEFGKNSDKIYDSDYIIISPGVPRKIPIIKKAIEKGIEVINDIELFYRLKFSETEIIAVTGSNGKSTTVSLIQHFFENSQFKSVLAGNIGTPISIFPYENCGIDFAVLELSSFQLESLVKFKADVAVLLNITPDHLNRYEDMAEYAKTKFNIFNNQKEIDLGIICHDDKIIAKNLISLNSEIQEFSYYVNKNAYFHDNKIMINNKYMKYEFELSKSPFIGIHNVYDAMAAILAVSKYIRDPKIIQNALNSFKTLEHRMEYVKSINGVKFYNDSKATNTDAVHFALNSFEGRVNIILGGSDKGENYSILTDDLNNKADRIFLIGEAKDNMLKDFSKVKREIITCKNLEESVKKAYQLSQKNGIVLLSPACASFDMFDNFEHRGRRFKEIVFEIKEEDFNV
jgi:UDP-N-acetylmuramoylalanine--D-glutamate ligase